MSAVAGEILSAHIQSSAVHAIHVNVVPCSNDEADLNQKDAEPSYPLGKDTHEVDVSEAEHGRKGNTDPNRFLRYIYFMKVVIE